MGRFGFASSGLISAGFAAPFSDFMTPFLPLVTSFLVASSSSQELPLLDDPLKCRILNLYFKFF